VIKTARDIMRKDAGLNGDLDRIPQMAWLLFLKAFDDLEDRRELRLRGRYTPVVDEQYRWRAWAGDRTARRTGDPLLHFVNEELLPHLAGLHGARCGPAEVASARRTLGEVFREIRNRMVSGYLLSDLVDQIDKVQFASTDDIHTMALMYESMLREMRDAAGDSGEFYTPRPVIRFMVDVVDPRLGETVLDPACGTGGFLVEAYEHLLRQAQTGTAKDLRRARSSLRGFEKKPLPYLLAQMNLLLHETDGADVHRGNALPFSLAEQKRSGADVVLTNPPFGGEEESSVIEAYPSTTRTAETAWLFLQSVMARIEASRTGRCGIVVPNGVLSADGIGARIKKKLFDEFDLHTVVRLPNGVFAPYTLIPSNLLFFERGRPTDEIWFYDLPTPEGRKNYTKTKPLRFEELEPVIAWWGGSDRKGRVENDYAWRVKAADVVADGYNLDLRNPNGGGDLAHRPPAELLAELIEIERELLGLLEELQVDLAGDDR
jgi:type I restriction enzyme M protein